MNLVFSTFRGNLLTVNESEIFSNSELICDEIWLTPLWAPWVDEHNDLVRVVSSAYKIKFNLSLTVCISFKYIRNNNGPKTERMRSVNSKAANSVECCFLKPCWLSNDRQQPTICHGFVCLNAWHHKGTNITTTVATASQQLVAHNIHVLQLSLNNPQHREQLRTYLQPLKEKASFTPGMTYSSMGNLSYIRNTWTLGSCVRIDSNTVDVHSLDAFSCILIGYVNSHRHKSPLHRNRICRPGCRYWKYSPGTLYSLSSHWAFLSVSKVFFPTQFIKSGKTVNELGLGILFLTWQNIGTISKMSARYLSYYLLWSRQCTLVQPSVTCHSHA